MPSEQIDDEDDEDYSALVRWEDLTHQFSLESYVDDQLRELYGDNLPTRVAERRQSMETFLQKLRCRTKPGDSWWDWVQGSEPLMQTGGVALVRNGAIVWATTTWIS
jgi:hypothetical protein